ncbi:hypothetical protein CSOJ01_08645 [Colletotrichum sojae]|uniref:DUF7704 domain-containing protein n=1 Tax=Colletotrichum sojae TaxID=2175907 RepID=A0A8H6J5A5_9PEZI|nr:hypothetical protein CSOJ01_08645 [Colletotrichum sojae]
MTKEPHRPTPASSAVPLAYQFLITTLEPVFALLGAVMTLHTPHQYLAGVTRNAVPFAEDTRFLYSQMAGGWLFFAFVEAVVLRMFDDADLWRFLAAGMLLSDAAYCHGSAQAVGGWAAWSDRGNWTVEDYVILGTTAPFVIARILLVLGVGVRTKRTKTE